MNDQIELRFGVNGYPNASPDGFAPPHDPESAPGTACWGLYRCPESFQNTHDEAWPSSLEMAPPLSSSLWTEAADTASLSSSATDSDLAFLTIPLSDEATSDATNPALDRTLSPSDTHTAPWSWNPNPCPTQLGDGHLAGFVDRASFPTAAAPSPLPSRSPEHNHSSHIPVPKQANRKRGRPRIYPEVDAEKKVKLTPEPPIEGGQPGQNENVTTTTASSSSWQGGKNNSNTHTTDTNAGVSTEKRQRNRAAASRYRRKLMTQIHGLEAETEEVTSRHRSLSAYAGQLREEIFELKNELLRHADCDYPPIQEYLTNELRPTWGPPARADNYSAGAFPEMA